MARAHPKDDQEWLDILGDIANGKSLRYACRVREIDVANCYKWIERDKIEDGEERATRVLQYARAMDSRADSLADEIDDLADQAVSDPARANAIRVAIDAKKWIACKLKPKKYGEKLDLNQSGNVGVTFQISGLDTKAPQTKDK